MLKGRKSHEDSWGWGIWYLVHLVLEGLVLLLIFCLFLLVELEDCLPVVWKVVEVQGRLIVVHRRRQWGQGPHDTLGDRLEWCWRISQTGCIEEIFSECGVESSWKLQVRIEVSGC